MKLSDCFPSTCIINLPERKDRRRDITRELESAGMPLRQGVVDMFPAVKPKEKLGFPSIGARGCFLSHLGILKMAAARKVASVLIIEDDLLISPLIKSHTDDIANELARQPWGLVYLGHVVENLSEPSTSRLLKYDLPVVTSHFYAVNGPVIPRLLEYLEQVMRREPGDPAGGPMHLDGALTMFRQANPDVITLIAHPNLGKQRPSRSDINGPWYEKLPGIKQAADLARSVRDSLRA